MMPTQWAQASISDSVVGWDSAAFSTAVGTSATYHGASAAASAIILSHAMKADPDVAKLAETIEGLEEVTTFYGPVNFKASGAIMKPMYTEQKQGSDIVIVAPSTATTHHAKDDMMFPLSSCEGWKEAATDANTTKEEGSVGVDGAATTSTVLGLTLTLVVQYLRA